MRKASQEENGRAIEEGIIFSGASKSAAHDDDKVRTKARKKAYRTGAHGSASAIKKANIRKHRAQKSRRK